MMRRLMALSLALLLAVAMAGGCLAAEDAPAVTMGGTVDGACVEMPEGSYTAGGLFLVCHDQRMMDQGSHFNAAAARNGSNTLLADRSFSEDYSLCGDDFHIELDYTVYDGQAVITYAPANSEGGLWRLPEAQIPVHAVPVLLTLPEGGYDGYPVLLDLETGELTDVPAASGIDLPKDIRSAVFSSDRSALLLRGADGTPYYCDLTSGAVYDLDELSGTHADVCMLGEEGVCCLTAEPFRAWTVALDGHAVKEIAADIDGLQFLPDTDQACGGGFALVLDGADNVFVLELFTGEQTPIEGFAWPGESAECALSPDGDRLCIYNHRYENEKLYVDAWVLDRAAGQMVRLNTAGTEEINPHAVYWSGNDRVTVWGDVPGVDAYWVYPL